MTTTTLLADVAISDFKERLEDLCEQLEIQLVRVHERESAALFNGSADESDVSADRTEWERAYAEEAVLRDRLADVERALAKFETGTYGKCERCGAPIPPARLRALPEARFDVVHQAEEEARAERES